MRKITFEEYLELVWQESVKGTSDDCLDDEMEDRFIEWLEDLDSDDLIKYANLYGRHMLLKGQAEGLIRGSEIAREVIAQV